MISEEGKLHIKRYLAGFVPTLAQSIAYGIGSAGESSADTKLQFEVGRVDIVLTSLDLVNSRLIYKGSLPDDFEGVICEAGIYSVSADVVAGEFGSRTLTTFDSETEEWRHPSSGALATYDSFARIGGDAMLHTAASTAGSITHQLAAQELDLSGYSSSDTFSFAFHVANGSTISGVRFRFITDASNYYEYVFGAQSNGYKILSATKGAAVPVGAPRWANINTIQVTTSYNAANGPLAEIRYDGIRIEDTDTVNPDYIMIAREALSTAFVKEEGQSQEIEFSMDIVL